MARGIIYVMTTVVPGLIKIGKTGKDNYEKRMYSLEHNGYFNVAGLKRKFAIEVDDYDEKESLLDEIFSKSRVPNSELFALDEDLVVQLLSSFDGTQIYPVSESKKQVFADAVKERLATQGWDKVPNGIYHLTHNIRNFGKVEATMRVEDGAFIVQKGSHCAPVKSGSKYPAIIDKAVIKGHILQEDLECDSPSTAGWVVLGKSNNGWTEWKDDNNIPLDTYRNQK